MLAIIRIQAGAKGIENNVNVTCPNPDNVTIGYHTSHVIKDHVCLSLFDSIDKVAANKRAKSNGIPLTTTTTTSRRSLTTVPAELSGGC